MRVTLLLAARAMAEKVYANGPQDHRRCCEMYIPQARLMYQPCHTPRYCYIHTPWRAGFASQAFIQTRLGALPMR